MMRVFKSGRVAIARDSTPDSTEEGSLRECDQCSVAMLAIRSPVTTTPPRAAE